MSDTNLNDASFTPEIQDSKESTNKQTYSATGSFRFWCQKVLPLVYDDSLSYYELLCKVVNYLNNVIQNVDNLNTSVDNTNTAFNNLQNYVNTTKDTLVEVYGELEQYVNDYFNNLDVQEEINSKLDSMAEDGSLSTIISPFIPSAVSDWLSKNITPTSPAVDASLTISGAAADAKKTGDLLNQTLIFKDLAPAAIDNLVAPGMYRLSVNTSSGSSTLPEKLVGTTAELLVFPVLGATHSAVQMIIDGLRQLFIRYAYDSDSGINPSPWNMLSEQEFNKYKDTLDNDTLIFRDLAPAKIDNLVTPGMYRLSVNISSGSSTLPEKLEGAVAELLVFPVLGTTHSAVQMIIDGLRQVFIRYVYKTDSGINPSKWNMFSEQELNKYKDYVSAQVKNEILSPTYVTGKYIVHNGNIDTNTQFQYSEPIELNENDNIIVYAKGYNQGVAMISECDSTGGYIRPIVISIDSSMHYYTYMATHHCYVIACGAISDMSVSCNRFGALFENLYSPENVSGLNVPLNINWTDGYISKNGAEYSSTDGRCKKSSVINVKAGYKICVKAYFNGTNLSIIARKNQDDTYTPLVISETGKTDYSYIPTEDMDIVVSSDARYEYYVRVVYPVSVNEKYSFSNMAMFETFGVVGDSFASGALMTSASAGYTKYNKSWGQILARELGATCINFSKGGLSTGDWLEDDKGLSLMLGSDPQELYLLMLGINDAYHLTNEPITPLGTIDDIKQDYTQNPVSFYGNYGRIIDQIKNHAPNAKLILFTVDEYGTETYISPNKSTINSAIEEIATHYGIPCLKQSEYWYFRSEYYLDNMHYSHPTAPVYSGMATAIRKMIEQAMVEHFDYFADAFMY